MKHITGKGISLSEISELDVEIPTSIPELPAQRCEEEDPDCEWVFVVTTSSGDPGTNGHWVCDCDPPPPPPGPTLNECGCPIPPNRRWAAGCIQVDDDGGDLGVWNVRVKVRNGFFSTRRTYSDRNGCWLVKHSHKGKVGIKLVFNNPHAKARHLRNVVGTRAMRDTRPTMGGPPYNNNFIRYFSGLPDNDSRARRLWYAAHVVTNVEHFREDVLATGVPAPPTNLNFIGGASGDAGAPMMEWRAYTSWADLALTLSGLNVLNALSIPFRPDIYLAHEQNDLAVDMRQTTFHELGHAVHYEQVGESYWFQYRNHIVANMGYGELNDFNLGSVPGVCALGEAVGNFTAGFYAFDPAGLENADFIDNYIPAGLGWDLFDGNQDNIINPATGVGGVDRVGGFTPAMFFQATGTDARTLPDFGDALRNQNINNTPTQPADFDELITAYDAL